MGKNAGILFLALGVGVLTIVSANGCSPFAGAPQKPATSVQPPAAETPQGLVGKPAPLFSLPTLAGEAISLHSLRGKPLFLVFGASW
ncbi:MAG: redoxin domain-containing protein [Chloroflexi bacterium]|nr:redoxin domain-containing protein [Chloroflexota bacterium]